MTPLRWKPRFILSLLPVLPVSFLVNCVWNLDIIGYTPQTGDGWAVSTPKEQCVDPSLIEQLYFNAAKRSTLYSLLVVKNGSLIAEAYFNGASADHIDKRASVTKSYTAALAGIALDKGYLTSLDQRMLEYFPELAGSISDPRKQSITLRQMLQMRAGYPWEETDDRLWEAMWTGDNIPLIEHFPLTADPGTQFQYSNLTADWLGIIVARACSTDLKTFGQQYLFDPLGATIGPWQRDVDGYYIGAGDIQVTARDMAKFGQLYLDGGIYNGKRIISEAWVDASLSTYTSNAWDIRIGRNIKNICYGYMWWSATSGNYTYNFAWGHGGNLIVILRDRNMVIVVTADPFYGKSEHFDSWKYEKANINLVADFIAKLP